MGYSIGYDKKWKRDIGYGVPSICDHPDCNEEIDRGLSYVCGTEPYGGERGCGLYFCGKHLDYTPTLGQLCDRCYPKVRKPYCAKPDTLEWVKHKLTDKSWSGWRAQHKREVKALEKRFSTRGFRLISHVDSA